MTKRIFLILLSGCLTSLKLQGALIFSDGFDYPDGPLETVASAIWQQYQNPPVGQTPSLRVEQGKVRILPYSGANGGGDGKAELGQIYGAGSTLFYGFDLHVLSLGQNPDTGLLIGFRQPTNLGGTIFIKAPETPDHGFRLGLSSDSFSTPGIMTPDLPLAKTLRVVVKLQITAIGATATLWVDPTEEASTSYTLSGTTPGRTYSQIGIYQTNNTRSLDLWIDNLRVGTEFSDVSAPTINHPPVIPLVEVTVTPGKNTLIDVLSTASDPDGDSLTIKEILSSGIGQAGIQDNAILFSSSSNDSGTTEVRYKVTDGTAEVEATLTIRFKAVVPAVFSIGDTFDYPDGLFQSAQAPGWSFFSGPPFHQILDGKLVLVPGAARGEQAALSLGREFASETLYVGFDLVVEGPVTSGTASTTAPYFFYFRSADNLFRGPLFVLAGSAPNTYQLGISASRTADANVLWPQAFQYGEPHRIVLAYHIATGEMRLWVDPVAQTSQSIADLGEPMSSQTNPLNQVVNRVAFRQNLANTHQRLDGTKQIDNLMVSLSFETARTGVVPATSALPAWMDGYTVSPSGWVLVPWLGWVDPSRAPWMHHARFGWFYSVGQADDSLFLYDLELGWLWTAAPYFPWLFQFNSSDWLYWFPGASDIRWFWSLRLRQWAVASYYSPAIEAGNDRLYSAKILPSVTVDGDLSDWPHFLPGQYIALKAFLPAGPSPLPEDVHVRAQIGWTANDDNRIYLAFLVKDDLRQDIFPANQQHWLDDSLEIIFHAAGIAYQFTVDMNGQDLSRSANSSNTTVAVQPLGDNLYAVEMAIQPGAWFRARTGLTLDLALNYNDGENGVREVQVGWILDVDNWQTVANAGKVRFMDAWGYTPPLPELPGTLELGPLLESGHTEVQYVARTSFNPIPIDGETAYDLRPGEWLQTKVEVVTGGWFDFIVRGRRYHDQRTGLRLLLNGQEVFFNEVFGEPNGSLQSLTTGRLQVDPGEYVLRLEAAGGTLLLHSFSLLPPDHLIWKSTFEVGNLSEWTGDGLGDFLPTGTGKATVVDTLSHTGSRCLKMEATGMETTTQAVRIHRWPRIPEGYFSAWMMWPVIPRLLTDGDNPFSNIFQFKETSPKNESDPTWYLWLERMPNSENGILRLREWQRSWPSPIAGKGNPVVQPGQWFHIEIYNRIGYGTGKLTVWINGEMYWDLNNINTKRFPDSGDVIRSWGPTLYGEDWEPGSITAYVDDCAISTRRLGPEYFGGSFTRYDPSVPLFQPVVPYQELKSANSWTGYIDTPRGLPTPIARLVDNRWWYENFEDTPVEVHNAIKQTLNEDTGDCTLVGIVPNEGVRGSRAFRADVAYLTASHPKYGKGGTHPGAPLIYIDGLTGGELYAFGYKIRTEQTKRSKFGFHLVYHPAGTTTHSNPLLVIQHEGANLQNSWTLDSRFAVPAGTWKPEWENSGGYTSQIVYPLLGGDSEGYYADYLDVRNYFPARHPSFTPEFIQRAASTIYYTVNHAEKYPEILFIDEQGIDVLNGAGFSRDRMYSAKRFVHASGLRTYQNAGRNQNRQFAIRVFPIPPAAAAVTLLMKLYHSYGGTVYFDDLYLERLGTPNEYLQFLRSFYGQNLEKLPAEYAAAPYIQKFLRGETVTAQDYWAGSFYPLPYHGRFEAVFQE